MSSNWHPVNPGRLHRHRRDLRRAQPLRQLVQVSGHAAKQTLLIDAVTFRIFLNQTGSDYLLMYIQTAAVPMHPHGASPLPLAKTPALKDSP
jgi:hypothetical protein